MDYGKRATSRRREALISRSSMLGKRAHVSLIRILFLSLIAILVVGVCVGVAEFESSAGFHRSDPAGSAA